MWVCLCLLCEITKQGSIYESFKHILDYFQIFNILLIEYENII